MEHVPETIVAPPIVADEYNDDNTCRFCGRIEFIDKLSKTETHEKLVTTKLLLLQFPTQDAILETSVTAVDEADVSGSGSAAGASAGWKTRASHDSAKERLREH